MITMALFVEKKNVFFTNNDSAYESAISLNKKGLNVEAIIDIREKSDSELVKEVEKIGIQIYWSHTVVDTHGYKRLKEIANYATFQGWHVGY